MIRVSNLVGFYELNPFPGSNQIVVSNHAFIKPEYRGKGFGQKQHKERLDYAKYLGYDLIICTVRSDNLVEKHILQKFNWLYAQSFKSTETEHELELWTRKL